MVLDIGITRTFRHLTLPLVCIFRVTGILEGISTPSTPSRFREPESTLFSSHLLVFSFFDSVAPIDRKASVFPQLYRPFLILCVGGPFNTVGITS